VSFDAAAIGRPGAEHRYEVTADALEAYAAATDDVVGGPVFAMVPVFAAIAPASRSVASGDVRRSAVHYEQDIRLHRPIEAGMTLVSQATPVALLPRPNGTSLVIRAETRTDDGALVGEQYVTEFFRGIVADVEVGERAPRAGGAVDGDPIAQVDHRIAEDQTVRYAAASGDDFAIHLDDEFARSVGLPGRIVHGLCTLAHAARSVAGIAGADPRAVRRVAVRFSAPVFPGDTLTTRVWRDDGGYAFDALVGERTVLKNGRLELTAQA
jgi:acyl dehydratase